MNILSSLVLSGPRCVYTDYTKNTNFVCNRMRGNVLSLGLPPGDDFMPHYRQLWKQNRRVAAWIGAYTAFLAGLAPISTQSAQHPPVSLHLCSNFHILSPASSFGVCFCSVFWHPDSFPEDSSDVWRLSGELDIAVDSCSFSWCMYVIVVFSIHRICILS